MNIEVEPQANCYARLIVTLSQDEVEQRYQKASRKVAKGASMPGFRPGKLPKALLERHYGPQIDQEALDLILQETLWPAISERQLNLVDRPTLESVSIKRGATGRYVATVEVFPTLPTPRYEQLAAPHEEPEVTSEQVDARLASEQKKAAVTVPCTSRTTIEQGDFVLCDYEGAHDGAVVEATRQSDQLLQVAPGKYLPGFIEGLVGQTVPGEARVPITFPTDYGFAPLAGKQVEFRFTLRELKVEELPSIDDEFAKDQGHADLAAMKAAIHAELLESAQADANAHNEQALLKALVAANPFELSTGVVDRQTEAMLENREARLKQLLGGRYALSESDRVDLRSSLREEAEQSVRMGLLVDEVAKVAKVEVSDEAIEARLDKLQADALAEAAARGQQADVAPDAFESPEARQRVRHQLVHEQVVALLAQTAQKLPAPPRAASEAPPGG